LNWRFIETPASNSNESCSVVYLNAVAPKTFAHSCMTKNMQACARHGNLNESPRALINDDLRPISEATINNAVIKINASDPIAGKSEAQTIANS